MHIHFGLFWSADIHTMNTSGLPLVPCEIVLIQKPDLVIVNRNSKTIILVELTVCFETGIVKVQERKHDRYAALLDNLT